MAAPAAVCWAVIVAGLLIPPAGLAGLTAGCGIIGAAAAVCRYRRWNRDVAASVAATALLGAAAGLVLLLRLQAVTEAELPPRTERVTATVTVADDPTGFGGGTIRTRARLHDVDGVALRPVPVLLTVPEQQWQRWAPGQRLTVTGRLTPPGDRVDDRLLAARLTASDTPVAAAPLGPLRAATEEIRERLRRNALAILPAPGDGLLPGLVVGDTSATDPELGEQFRAAGLSHLTAVSGFNFALICGAVVLAVRATGAGPRLTALLGLVAVVGFVLLVRPTPSVLRAAVMGGIGLLALFGSRRSQALPALCAAIIGILLWWPQLAPAPGFVLSVAATAGLVVAAPTIRDRLRMRDVPRGLAEALAVAVAAQVATAPLIIGFFGEFSLTSLPANLLVTPVVAVISILGTAAALLGGIGSGGGIVGGLAELLLRATEPGLWWMVAVARLLGGQQWSLIEVGSGPVPIVACTGLIAVAAAGLRAVGTEWHHEGRGITFAAMSRRGGVPHLPRGGDGDRSRRGGRRRRRSGDQGARRRGG